MDKFKIIGVVSFLCFLSCSKKVISNNEGKGQKPIIIETDCCKYYLDSTLMEYVYTEVDMPPKYKEGKASFLTDFLERYNHPVEEEFPPKTLIEIVISKNGQILSVNVSTKEETSYKVINEIRTTIFSLSSWTIGKCNDTNVTCKISFPIMF